MPQHSKKFVSRFSALALVLLFTVSATAGAVQRISRVEAFDTDIWTIRVPSGDSRVIVDGDGDTDLDCYVYDLGGRLLGMDDDSTDYCIVDVWRARGGNLKLHIVNLGNVYNRYELRIE